MNSFIRHLLSIYKISDDNLNLLLNNMEKVMLKKGDCIVCEGETNTNLYLVEHGIIRAHYLNEGEEITVWFAFDGEAVFSSWGFVSDSASQLTIEASCDTSVFCITKEGFENLCNLSIGLANWGRKLMERLWIDMDNRLVSTGTNKAEERYKLLIAEYPQILQYVPLKHIASYIWVTPQSLSRIRAAYKKRLK